MKYRRFYVTGDTHGEPGRFMYTDTAFEKIADSGDILFIAGDFGFVWDNSPEEQAIREIIAEKKYTTCFVDGNHENFDLLESYPVSHWCGGKVHVIGEAPDGTPKRALARVNCAMAFGPLPERFIRMNHTNRSAMPTSRYGSAVMIALKPLE